MPYDTTGEDAIIDVRRIPHHQRHPLIFGTLERMQPGKSFVLVNDHDPRPLHHHLQAGYAGQFTWEYLEQGPEIWCVRIGKAGADDHVCHCGGS